VLSTLELAKILNFACGVWNDMAPWGATGVAQVIYPMDLYVVWEGVAGGHKG